MLEQGGLESFILAGASVGTTSKAGIDAFCRSAAVTSADIYISEVTTDHRWYPRFEGDCTAARRYRRYAG